MKKALKVVAASPLKVTDGDIAKYVKDHPRDLILFEGYPVLFDEPQPWKSDDAIGRYVDPGIAGLWTPKVVPVPRIDTTRYAVVEVENGDVEHGRRRIVYHQKRWRWWYTLKSRLGLNGGWVEYDEEKDIPE